MTSEEQAEQDADRARILVQELREAVEDVNRAIRLVNDTTALEASLAFPLDHATRHLDVRIHDERRRTARALLDEAMVSAAKRKQE